MLRVINELPIIDAKRKATLVITKKDIAKADTQEPDSCAVAQACKRMLHAAEVRVHLSRIYIRSNQGNWQRYMTPQSLRSEIIAFDRGGQFEPGTYTLSPPSRTKVASGKRQGSAKDKRRQVPRKRKYHVVTNVRTGPAQH